VGTDCWQVLSQAGRGWTAGYIEEHYVEAKAEHSWCACKHPRAHAGDLPGINVSGILQRPAVSLDHGGIWDGHRESIVSL
jgi:hypothetical protein